MNFTYSIAVAAQLVGIALIMAGMVTMHYLKGKDEALQRAEQKTLRAEAERAREHLGDPNAPRWVSKALEHDLKTFLRAHPPVIMHFGALKNQRETVTFALALQKVCYEEGWTSSFQVIEPLSGVPVPVNVWITGDADYREAFAHILRTHGITVEYVGATLDGWSYGYDDAGLGVYVGVKKQS